jgi:hypothetical protein
MTNIVVWHERVSISGGSHEFCVDHLAFTNQQKVGI